MLITQIGNYSGVVKGHSIRATDNGGYTCQILLEGTEFQAEKGMKYLPLEKPASIMAFANLSWINKETGKVVVNEESVTGRKGWVDYLKEAFGWNGVDESIAENKYAGTEVNFWVREQSRKNPNTGEYEVVFDEKTGAARLEVGAIYKKGGGIKAAAPELVKSFGAGWRTVPAPKPVKQEPAPKAVEDDIPF